MYQALGANPPEYLAQPIIGAASRPSFIPQTAYIHPRVAGDMVRYFEWIGAAMYTADQRSGAMHGKSFLLDSVYAGIDETSVYGRLDFVDKIPEVPFELVVNLESWATEPRPRRALRLDATVQDRRIHSWRVTQPGEEEPVVSSDRGQSSEAKLVLARNFEFKLPLKWLLAAPISSQHAGKAAVPVTTRIRVRFSLWQHGLPVDALPLEGWIELQLLSENELAALAF